MRLTILTLGTRGDVQPYVALALALKAAGHEVRLAALDIFEEFISNYGLEFFSLGSVSQEFRERTKVERSQNTIPFYGVQGRIKFWRIFSSFLEPLLKNSWDASQGAEAILYSRLVLSGYHIAEKLGVPCFSAYTNPLTPTRAFPNPLYTSNNHLDGTLNLLTHICEEQFRWQFARNKINRWRQKILNLPSIPMIDIYSRQKSQKIPILHCYSPTVIPKPSDWQDWAYVTGYWFLDSPSSWQPPKELVDFLESGSPPVSIGFGSMSDSDPEGLTELILKALAQTGHRGILLTGWGGISNADLPDYVFKINSVPHKWLFPKVAAVVHHGGAGTTSAGLRAGVPSIIIPFGADQPFWGQRVADLGVGTKPIPRKELTVEKLAAAIKIACGNEAMKARARVLGEQIRSENGVARAVEIFHSYIRSH